MVRVVHIRITEHILGFAIRLSLTTSSTTYFFLTKPSCLRFHVFDTVLFCVFLSVVIGVQVVESVIMKERPDGVVVSMGGQTALNCGVALHNKGVSRADPFCSVWPHALLLFFL